ncbi:MAG: trigger factor [Clostridiales bacterium]|nr:trigger factor [Clostridiales bacterium]
MKKKIAVLLICSVSAMTLLAGCGQEDSGDYGSSDSSVSAETETDATVAADVLLAATDYDVTEYVTLMDGYMELAVELTSDYQVSDDAVQTYVETYMLPYYPMTVETDKTTVEDGDTVNIDYVGTLDGEEFDGGSASGYDLTIGSDTFIDGFEDGLIGAEVGSTVDLDLTFPEDYSSEDLAGQAVVFTVTVNSIVEEQVLTYDEITDEYVTSVLGDYYSTVDEMLEDVEAYLESSYESERTSAIQESVLEQLIAGCTVTFPDGLLEERINSVIEQTEEAAEYYGMEYEDYIATYYSSYATTAEEFETYVSETLEESLTQELILEAIVADQQISISTSDFADFVSSYVSYYEYDSEETFYESYGGEEYVMLSYAENQALTAVMDAATITVVESADETEDTAEADSAEETDTAEEATEDESEE